MAILISNDDGIFAPGINALAQALKGDENLFGDVFVVAPDRERSATSHSLTLHRPLRIKELADKKFSVDGTPTDCVLLAIKTLLPQKPKILISGINHGANLGDDVTYSGTVSAALEGAILGIPSVAISLVGQDRFEFGLAVRFARSLVQKVIEKGLPKGVFLNVNIPGDLVEYTEKDENLPYCVTHTGKRDYGSVIFEKLDPRNRKYYWIGGDPNGFEQIPGTDCNALLQKQISVTPLHADMTDYKFLKDLRCWEIHGFCHSTPETS